MLVTQGPGQDILVFLAAIGAGWMNAIAGGGTNLAFPVLLWLGIPAVRANATNSAALWPGALSGAWGFRREIASVERRWLWLMAPSLAGGAIGALLLSHTPPQFFKSLAPYLVLGSSILIAFKATFHSGGSKAHPKLGLLTQFIVSAYGGYFGAGLGILVLTSLGFLGMSNIRKADGPKNLFVAASKGVAVIYFIVTGMLVWRAVIVMAIGAVMGGYVGGVMGHRMNERLLRWIVVVIGIGIGVMMLRKL